MPWWYYNKQELRNTPSIRDGIEYELECQYRKEGARFIIDTGNKMDLGYNTMATGVVYFHRFYMVHSFVAFPRYLTAACALFLAGKVEETPKKAKDVIKMAENRLEADEFAEFGEDPKEELLILERILLQSIKFDLQVDHPYAFLLKYAKSLKTGNSERQKMQDVLQMAWTFVNDSLCTTLCLQWEPEVIAVAMLYLAAKLSKYDINNWVGKTANQKSWWEMFVNGVTLDLLEDICHQVLDLYSQKRAITSSNTLLNSTTNQHTHQSNSSTHSGKSSTSQRSMQIPSVTHKAAETLPPLPTNSVLPTISNPLPNINSITNIYQPAPNVAQPPPPVYSVPPPGLPPMGGPPHDTSAPPPMYAPPGQYNPIPTHYTGSASQYASYPQYGSNY